MALQSSIQLTENWGKNFETIWDRFVSIVEKVQKREELHREQQQKRQKTLWNWGKKFQNNERRKIRGKKQTGDWNIRRKQKTLKFKMVKKMENLSRKLKDEKRLLQCQGQNGVSQQRKTETGQWIKKRKGKISKLYKVKKMNFLRKIQEQRRFLQNQGQIGGIKQRKTETGKIILRENLALIVLDLDARVRRGIG